MAHSPRLLRVGQAAGLCEVSAGALKLWIRQGRLKAFRTPGGHLRITAEELQRFRLAQGFPVAETEAARMLVVDDDPHITELLLEILRTEFPDATLGTASDGYEGLIKLGELRPHLLVLDLYMPRLDGFEVCRRVRSDPALSHTRILVITGTSDPDTHEEARRAGADVVLAKPLAIDVVQQEARRLIETRAARTGAGA